MIFILWPTFHAVSQSSSIPLPRYASKLLNKFVSFIDIFVSQSQTTCLEHLHLQCDKLVSIIKGRFGGRLTQALHYSPRLMHSCVLRVYLSDEDSGHTVLLDSIPPWLAFAIVSSHLMSASQEVHFIAVALSRSHFALLNLFYQILCLAAILNIALLLLENKCEDWTACWGYSLPAAAITVSLLGIICGQGLIRCW